MTPADRDAMLQSVGKLMLLAVLLISVPLLCVAASAYVAMKRAEIREEMRDAQREYERHRRALEEHTRRMEAYRLPLDEPRTQP